MILIVDDNQSNIYSLKELLEIHKFVVDSATSGEEALRKVLKNTYSLIILDVQMPDMDGFEVAESISGFNKSKDIPIIFLSAVNTEKKFITKGYLSGGVDYITKPFDPDLLLLKVKTFYKISEQNRKLSEMDTFLREEIEFRKKAESELKERVEELKSILESMPQMAFTTKTDGDIEYVNNHWSAYSDDKLAFPVAEGPTIKSIMQGAVTSQHQVIQEVKIQALKNLEFRFHVLYLTPVIQNGHLIKWVGIFTDIHEQKMASQTLENKVAERTIELKLANKKLEESNNELQQFAFVASHDLQEPLRKIQVFTNMVMESYVPQHPEGKHFFQKILSAADRMRKLITDLLDYSRPDKELFSTPDLNAIISEVISDLELKIKAKSATIHVGKIPSIESIPGQMKQVFQNLISNALKFSSPERPPVITIEGSLVAEKSAAARPDPQGKFCKITVTDNGIGFDQIYAEKIFEIFQRLNRVESFEGTGIGLAIVKKRIDSHNGIITVNSEERLGTTFTIVLPLSQKDVLS